MKKALTLFVLLLMSVFAFAQNPKLRYQAVVRDSQNKLVVEQSVTVTVNVLKADNTSQFEQTLNANTNRNGLMSLEIGDETAAWSNIYWEGAKIRTAITLPNGSQVVDTSNVNAVPFALYANSVSDEVLNNLMEAQSSQMDAFQQSLDTLSHLFFDYAYLDGKPCPLTSTMSDGTNSYPTVVIGKQCWMAQNLRTTAGLDYRDDYFHANNNENNDEEYGLLYTWYAATDNQTQDEGHPMVKGICPEGWHIPSIAEWNTMTSYINSRPTQFKHCGNGNIASTLASKTRWSGSSDVDCSPAKDLSANNTTGFNILPAGEYFNGPFDYGTSSYFWSSSELAYNYAYHVRFFNNSAEANIDNFDMNGAFSVRCLRNKKVVSSSESASSTISCDDVKTCIADELNKYTPTNQFCDVVNHCDLSSNTSIANLSTLLQGLSNQMENMNEKMDSLNHLVDSLSNQPPVQTFICGSYTVDDHEGNTYNTVKIGNQCWTKENMRCTTSPSTGSTILDRQEEISYSGKKAYYYNNTTSNAANGFGLLYNWCAAVDTFNTTMGETSTSNSHNDAPDVTFTGKRRGICPQGWHVPNYKDWTQLQQYMFTQSEYLCGTLPNDIAKSLASTEYWEIDSFHICAVGNMPNENNKSGFSALPAGGRADNSCDFRGSNAFFWSATQSNPVSAYYLSISNTGATAILNPYNKNVAYSVRCLRDGGVTGKAGANEMQSSTTSMSCDDVINCLGDTLGKLNAKIEAQGYTITEQGNALDSLNHLVDSLSNQIPTPVYPSFTCGHYTVKDHEGNVYNTVRIGEQCWTKENMRCTTSPSTGTVILEHPASSYSYTGKKAYYPDSIAYNVTDYGLLYNWCATIDTFNTTYEETSTNTDFEQALQVTFSGNRRGICPQGWHVPSEAEWKQLRGYMVSHSQYWCNGDSTYIAKALASSTGWSANSNDCGVGNTQNNNNTSGFTALPAGFYTNGFFNFGYHAHFWSAKQSNAFSAFFFQLDYYHPNVLYEDSGKNKGASVRCLRDGGISDNTGDNEMQANG